MKLISLQNGSYFNFTDENNIFESAKKNNIFIEHSCLNGRCSACKAKVISGQTVETSFEYGLNEDEKNDGFILTCVRKPLTDLILDVNVIENFQLIIPRTLPSKIDSICFLTKDIIKLTLRLPINSNFIFIPGQYVKLIKGVVKRSYSIGGLDEKKNLIFYIKNYVNGKFSKYLFEEAKENDLIRIEGPLGSFFFRNKNHENVIFLATGTGIAPIKSIIEDLIEKNIIKKNNIFLFHGGRYEEELLECDYFFYLHKNGYIKYFPVLSRQDNTKYFKGYVQDICIKQINNFKNSVVYACGSIQMILDSKEKLTKFSLSKSDFYSDAFVES